MALILCSECGKEVSEKAVSCPNCGVPIATPANFSLDRKTHIKVTRSGAKWEGIGFVLIAIGIVLLLIPKTAGIGGMLFLVGFIVFLVGRFK